MLVQQYRILISKLGKKLAILTPIFTDYEDFHLISGFVSSNDDSHVEITLFEPGNMFDGTDNVPEFISDIKASVDFKTIFAKVMDDADPETQIGWHKLMTEAEGINLN